MRVAAFPSPPFVEREDPTEVDWEAATPVQWPADLDDLFANNPAGARTWSEVEAAMHRLMTYHTVRDTSRFLSVMARQHAALAHTHHARSARFPPPLLADAAAALCFCKQTGTAPERLKSAWRVHSTAPLGTTGLKRDRPSHSTAPLGTTGAKKGSPIPQHRSTWDHRG